MRKKSNLLPTLFGAFAVLILILDTKTAFSGAVAGVKLCLYTMIPALFPFFVVSAYLNSRLCQMPLSFLKPIGIFCKIPVGSEGLLLLGFLGGYPIGVQNVAQAFDNKILSYQTARRMTLFCNNAGPAFLFGMAASVFESRYIPWILWAIHIAVSLLIAAFLPKREQAGCANFSTDAISLTAAMEKGLRSISILSGWVILFRILSAFILRWFGFMLSPALKVFLVGTLELANGCSELQSISSEGLRFILCAFLLGFGGLCVAMQSFSVCRILPVKKYVCCKLLHGALSMLFAYLLQFFLFPPAQQIIYSPWFPGVGILLILTLALPVRKRKKVVAIPG